MKSFLHISYIQNKSNICFKVESRTYKSTCSLILHYYVTSKTINRFVYLF